jgi:uncharacterized protein YdeI (BOF family)
MKRLLLMVVLVNVLLLAGCGGEQYGPGVDAGAPTVKVRDLFLRQELLSQKVSLEGKIVSQCQSNGCWFFLQDDTGQIYIDLATNNFSLPSLPGKQVVASGTVARSKQNVLLVASGVKVK